MLTGVVEVGLFCHMAQAAYFGNDVTVLWLCFYFRIADVFFFQDGSVTVKWKDGKVERLEAKTGEGSSFLSGGAPVG